MTEDDLQVIDLKTLAARHAARTEMLRVLHTVRRPALDRAERDSEQRIVLAALVIVTAPLLGLFVAVAIVFSAINYLKGR